MLSLPLMSLSTAEDADANQQKFSWQKETHDLTFVIDSYGGRDSSQLIKVVQGTQVRHVIEVERFVKEGEQLIRQMQGRGVQMQNEQLPISAIVRVPLLAIRWQLPDQKIRRIQVRFSSDKDFDTAFHRLHQIGLRMSEHGSPSNASRLPAPHLNPAPQSLLPVRPVVTAAAFEQPHSGATTGSRLSCPPSRLAEISSRPHKATNAPAPFESQPQQFSHNRPTSASSGSDRRDVFMSTSFSDPLNPPVLFPRPHSATADILSRSSNNASSFAEQYVSTVEEVPPASADRPETAMLFNRPGTSETLPPRRELPFQRLSEPRSSGSDSARGSDRPSTGLMGPPALPRSAAQRPGSSRSAKSKDMDLPPLPQPTVIDKTAGGKKPTQQPPRTPNHDQNFLQRAKTSPANRLDNEPSFSASLSPLSSPLAFNKSNIPTLSSPQTQYTPGIETGNLQGSMLEHRHHFPGIATVPGTSHQASNATSATSTTVGIDDAERLAAYTMQSDEGRRAALNEFIFRHLESDDFLTLVEDMETAWARVALGMR